MIQTVLNRILNLRGALWMGLFSWVMLAGLVRCLFFGAADIPSGALGLYGSVLATFGITKLGAKAINGKNGKEVEEND
jgi:hypothetical protein